MNNQLTTSEYFNESELDILKNMYCKGLSDDEVNVFLHICKRTGLDPRARQLYPVKRPNRKTGKDDLTIQTGIDGYRLIAERTGKYAPGKESTYKYDDKGRLLSATSYIKKMTLDGTWHEVAANALYCEYVQTKYDGAPTQFWVKMGHTMLAKCAEALALRKAFPNDFSGIYTKEEMMQAEVVDSECEVSNVKPEEHTQKTKEIQHEEIIYLTNGDIQQIEILLNGDENHKNKLLNHYAVTDLSQINRCQIDKIINSCVKNNKNKEASNGQN